jgi:hypothetical protein
LPACAGPDRYQDQARERRLCRVVAGRDGHHRHGRLFDLPFILPSSIDAHSSLTVWNASSTQKTLGIMLFVTIVFLPIVLAYTAWAYRVMFGRVTAEAVRTNPDFY